MFYKRPHILLRKKSFLVTQDIAENHTIMSKMLILFLLIQYSKMLIQYSKNYTDNDSYFTLISV